MSDTSKLMGSIGINSVYALRDRQLVSVRTVGDNEYVYVGNECVWPKDKPLFAKPKSKAPTPYVFGVMIGRWLVSLLFGKR